MSHRPSRSSRTNCRHRPSRENSPRALPLLLPLPLPLPLLLLLFRTGVGGACEKNKNLHNNINNNNSHHCGDEKRVEASSKPKAQAPTPTPLPLLLLRLLLLLALAVGGWWARNAGTMAPGGLRRLPRFARNAPGARWLRAGGSVGFLPVADALAVSRAPTRTTGGTTAQRSFSSLRGFSPSAATTPPPPPPRSALCAAAVPEDGSGGGNEGATVPPFPPPIGEGHDPGVLGFGLDELPPEGYDDYTIGHARKVDEDVANPFPFPEPSFSYTEEGNSLEGSSYFTSQTATPNAPFTVPEPSPTPTDDIDIGNGNDIGIGNHVDATPKTAARIGATAPDSYAYPNTETTGIRSMTTAANAANDALPSTPDVEGIGNKAGRASLAPFASVTEDTAGGPAPPLVAPLKLSKPSSSSSSPIAPSIETNGLDDIVDSLEGQLKSIRDEIETMAQSDDGTAIATTNLNSPKQVSLLLFGKPNVSTSKATLEGMAGSNILAKLVLEYRDTKRKLNKVLKQQKSRNASDEANHAGTFSSSSSSSQPQSQPVRPLKDPLLLFDTSSFIFRAYYSNPPIHRGKDGMPTGAVMGFCSMLNKLLLTSMLKGETPLLVQCLDAPGKTFRNDLYEDYKAHRPPIPLDLVPQFDLINEAAKAYGMIQIQATGFEADDVIATLATIGSQEEGLDVKILSGDKDLMQLITNDDDDDEASTSSGTGRVHMMDAMTSKLWTHDGVIEKWGVGASQLGDVLALAGDSADNVPGVPGIGPKIAARLLQEFGTLESLLSNTDKIPQPKRRETLDANADSARISRELVELERGLKWSQMQAYYPTNGRSEDDDEPMPMPMPMIDSTKVGDLRTQPIEVDRILAFYDTMGFHRLRNQLLDQAAKIRPETERPTRASSPAAAEPAATAAARTEPPRARNPDEKPSTKRNFWEKRARGVPKPEDYEDVPF